MATPGVPSVPESVKSIRPFITAAKDHDQRDPVVSYFCRRYAMEIAVKMRNRPPEVTTFLIELMDQLERQKKELIGASNEAMASDVVASAHVENYAVKLFLYADTEDRNGIANKNVVKSFHTAGVLFDVMQTFGELTEEIVQNRKYAKWKATYIHGCLKRGEIPQPGPEGGDEAGGAGGPVPHPSTLQPMPPADQPPASQQPGYPPSSGGAYPPGEAYPPGAAAFPPVQHPAVNQLAPGVPPGVHAPPSTPDQGGYQSGMPGPSPSSEGGVQLHPQDFTKAQKYCKFASSALQYEDVPTAIENLEKALRLLRTGRE